MKYWKIKENSIELSPLIFQNGVINAELRGVIELSESDVCSLKLKEIWLCREVDFVLSSQYNSS